MGGLMIWVVVALLAVIFLMTLLIVWQIKQSNKLFKILLIREVHTYAQYSFCDDEVIFSREERIDYFPIKTLTHLLTIRTHTPPVIGAYLGDKFSDMKIDILKFGKSKIAGMVPMMLELGGKDAAIVLKDADLEDTAREIVSGAYSYAGQRCTAIKRVLVTEDIADELVSLMLKQVKKLSVGHPKDGCEVTPLINNSSVKFVQELIDDAITKGATLLFGNKTDKNLMYPTLFDNVKLNMRLAWEEPFGPVLPIIRVKDMDEAIEIANRSQYGLQSSVFTKNINHAFYVANKLEVGAVQINNKSERGPDHFPFSGVKASGMGTQGIRYSIEAMSRLKSVVLNIDEHKN